MRTQTFGTPGSHARSLALAGFARACAMGAAAALAAAASLYLALPEVFSGELGPRLVLALVTAAAAAVCGHQAQRHWVRAKKAEIGWRSERRVADALRGAGAAVCHGLLLGAGGDVDHVVLGPSAVAIETKTGAGRVRVESGATFAGRRRIPGDPVAQVRRQASSLSRALGNRPVAAVVCIPDMTNKAFSTSGVVVCGLGDLPRVVAAQSRAFADQAEAIQVAERLAKGSAARDADARRRS